MEKVVTWIARHPVVSFFSLTYAISWPLGFIAFFLVTENRILQGLLGTVAVFAPVLSGIAVSAAANRTKDPGRHRKRPVFFLVFWLFSAGVLTLFMWQVRGMPVRIQMMAFIGLIAVLPAYVLAAPFSRRAATRTYLQSLVKPRGHIVWYAVALFTFPLVQFGAFGIARMLGVASDWSFQLRPDMHSIGLVLFTLLYQLLFAGGINEESGWRGYVIPKLQKRFSPLLSAVIVWCFWALWHLFYDISSGQSVEAILFNRLVHNLLWSILFVWVFNRTNGSILAPALFHASMNTSSQFFPRTDMALVVFIVLTICVIASDRMWRTLPKKIEKQ